MTFIIASVQYTFSLEKIVCIVFFIIGFSNIGFSQKPLSIEEKTVDFNYLHQELEKSYPYFDINKRMNNIDWLSKKNEYLKQIIETKNDEDFFKALTSILNALNNDHTDTYPTIIYDYFHKAYKGASTEDSSYLPYVRELEKTDTIRTKYWKLINHEILSNQKSSTDTQFAEEITKNVKTDFNDSLSIATISINSFSYDLIENDSEKLRSFFSKVYKYKNLIIDIQGNEGGDTGYWIEHIIPYLIKDTITFSTTYGFKNSERLRIFKPKYFINTISYEDIELPNMPKELTNGSYTFRTDNTTIDPNSKGRKYLGNTYLLVDNVVFSSAETLAYFCKTTKFATVVGEKTNGDGVGTDPLLLTLPNSGIVIRFTGEMGLNPDGSANDETKTVPDLMIKAANKKERLKKLLDHIKYKN